VKRTASTETYLTSVRRLIESAAHLELEIFHGIDFSGAESGGLTKGTAGLQPKQVQALRGVIEHNYSVLQGHLAADPQLHAQAKERLATALEKPGFRSQLEAMLERAGIKKVDMTDPVAVAEAFHHAIDPKGKTLTAHEGLAVMNRLIRDTIVEVDGARGGKSRLASGKPLAGADAEAVAKTRKARRKGQAVESAAVEKTLQPLLGTTVHGGEQVHGSVALSVLVEDMKLIASSGADRAGHGVILGVALTTAEGAVDHAALKKLDFRWNDDLKVWEREHGKGTFERYSEDQIRHLDGERRAVLHKIADLGIVIEINPTSNIVLSGLDPSEHPLRQMLKERPDLRFSVNTDNPGIHLIDASSELALLYATGVLKWPQVVQAALEGYASRLGTRPIEGPWGMRRQTERAILAGTPPGERQAVIDQLKQRYPGTKLPDGVDVTTEEGFRKALRPYLRRTFQGAK
jgi:hypothetical protein